MSLSLLCYSLSLFVETTNAFMFMKSLDEPFVTSLSKYTGGDLHNFVYSDKYHDELTDKSETIYRRCESPYTPHPLPPTTYHWIEIGTSASIDYLNWRCTEKADGKLSLEPVSFPGCYYDGKVYKIGERWNEKNPGDHITSPYVEMECYRSESGYFDKKVTDMACIYKNETHPYKSSWIDEEINAELYCSDANRVVKTNCVIRGHYYSTSVYDEYRLSNGCTFICNEQKNIFKCPNLLPSLKTVEAVGTKASE
ncbi:unnamed protein product [Caenorhabditis brenneri]